MAIYKRPPVQHTLPSGWDDLDNVRFNSINNIKGLQHYDNPLIGDQNSTYNCKNVYQDESGNLTVRPAVRQLRSLHDYANVLGIYKTSIGQIIHYTDDTKYYLKGAGTSVQIGSGNIAVQESDNKVYILHKSIAGTLQFRQWTGYGFSDFEPDLPLNTPEPSSRLFNLLSDKTKYAVAPVLSGYITSDLFTDSYSTYVNKGDALAISVMSTGHIVFVYTDAIIVGVPYGSAYNIVEISVSIPRGSDVLIEDLSNSVQCIVGAAYDDGTNIVRSKYLVQYNGSIQASSWSIKKPSDFIDYKIGYDDTLFISSIIDDPLSDSKYTACVNRYVSAVNKTQLSYEYTFATPTKGISVMIGASKKGFVVIVYSAYLNSIYVDPWSFEYLDSPEESKTGKYYVLRELNADYGDISVISTADYWYIIDHASNLIYYDWDNYEYSIGISALVKPEPMQLGFAITTDIIATQDGLIIKSGGTYYYISPVYYRSYDITGDAVFNYDGTIIVKSTNSGYTIMTRELKQQYITVAREVSENIPVLSLIQDEILTSFYLDNIYWFITKHRIFGTGVANEQFSIKYFDPRKYFHFDEELTAAIRISDTAFWVFHNKGSYLIYKSTTQLYDAATEEYIEMITWLCTAAAESKGCDFDNAVLTLPVTSHIASVTSDDISYVTMRENVQTDDRILVPMTLQLQQFVASLLNETNDIVVANYKYNALFFLNPANLNNTVSVLVYNAASKAWWYWKLPFTKITQARTTETNIEFIACYNGSYSVYDFYTEYYDYTIGGLTYHIYADRLNAQKPVQIEWFWESALLHFDSVDYRKQLLFTNFSLSERDTAEIAFEYNFEIYDNSYSDKDWSEVYTIVERAKTHMCRTSIARFKYLQIYLKNQTLDDYAGYTKPKFNAINFKYRLLTGGIL